MRNEKEGMVVDLKTKDAQEAFARVDTIHWVSHVAMLSMSRYRDILSNRQAFSVLFPNVTFENPKINHKVGDHGSLLTTTKKELLAKNNYDLYKAWQIVLAIAGMSSILEYYLKTVAESLTEHDCQAMGIFHRFKDETGVRITEFPDYKRLRHFYELRNISLHNLGRINERFKKKTAEPHHRDGPYIYYPSQVTEYRDILKLFFSFVEDRL